MQSRIKMPQEVEYILNELHANGHRAYIVGGCVRDSILNKIPNDWDVTTSALPGDISDIFSAKGNRIIPTGIKHGTVTILIGNKSYEVTTFRLDGNYSDNRHPDSVEFTDNLKEDLSRRDFTINAMAYNNIDGFMDYFGGLADINNKIIRCVGDAGKRFKEDSLRMMRAIRFSAQLAFTIETGTEKALEENAGLIKNISSERIRDELNKILTSSHPEYVGKMYTCKVLHYILPEYEECFGCTQNNPYHIYNVGMHIQESLKQIENSLALRLTMLFHDIAKPVCKVTDGSGIDHFYKHAVESSKMAYDIMKRLRYDNNTIGQVCKLVKYHDTVINSKKTIRRLLNKLDKENMDNLLKIRLADIKAQNPKYFDERYNKIMKIKDETAEIIEKNQCFQLKDLAVDGRDLMQLGCGQGRQIGIILNMLFDRVMENPELNNRKDLLKLVDDYKL